MVQLKDILTDARPEEVESRTDFFKALQKTRKKLDPIVKASWLYWLRSGKYRQGIEALQSPESNRPTFCCLGVLADIIEGVTWVDGDWSLTNCSFKGEKNVAILPKQLERELNLTNKLQNRFAEANDTGHLSFDDIADVVERFL